MSNQTTVETGEKVVERKPRKETHWGDDVTSFLRHISYEKPSAGQIRTVKGGTAPSQKGTHTRAREKEGTIFFERGAGSYETLTTPITRS